MGLHPEAHPIDANRLQVIPEHSTDGAEITATIERVRGLFHTLEGHWAWWVRVEGHFVKIPPEKKAQCDQEVRSALQSLGEPRGIPYTIHELHVRVRRRS